ncbi:hypothetical protein LB505_008784 [Fusarium chuoi]|nr:hypothetical protein LB505_008784 [Fusarium chuoi]
MWKLQLERTAFQNRYLDRWNKAGIDAIVSATTPYSTGKHGSLRHDDAELVHGLPVSLQIVARRLEEEKVIAMAKLVHETVG